MGIKSESCHDHMIAAISKCWLMIKNKAQKLLSEINYDLTFEQIIVLHILKDEEGMNLTTIAERADRERTTISRMVDGLEKRNLVVRIPDKIDKRQKLLYLTKLGRDRIQDLEPIGELLLGKMYKDISDDEVKESLSTVTKMIQNLDE